jgi:membrane-associated phospholipid phosphatase
MIESGTRRPRPAGGAVLAPRRRGCPATVRISCPVHRLSIILLAGYLAFGTPGRGLAQPAEQVIHPWEHVGDSLGGIYGWPNVLFHVGAVAVTPPLVYTLDGPVQTYFQEHDPLTNTFGEVTLIVGGVVPVALPLGLYLGGLAGDDAELATAGAAVLQAELIQVVVVTTLKWLTDRAGPYPDGDPNAERWSEGTLRDSDDPADFNFNPFDLEGGLRWPSGHTASNVALVSTLVAFYPDEVWLPIVGYPFALAIGVGMIEGDYHWLSDVVAGALIGHVIGWVVGRQFRAAFEAGKAPHAGNSVQVSLVPGPGTLHLIGTF